MPTFYKIKHGFLTAQLGTLTLAGTLPSKIQSITAFSPTRPTSLACCGTCTGSRTEQTFFAFSISSNFWMDVHKIWGAAERTWAARH